MLCSGEAFAYRMAQMVGHSLNVRQTQDTIRETTVHHNASDFREMVTYVWIRINVFGIYAVMDAFAVPSFPGARRIQRGIEKDGEP